MGHTYRNLVIFYLVTGEFHLNRHGRRKNVPSRKRQQRREKLTNQKACKLIEIKF